MIQDAIRAYIKTLDHNLLLHREEKKHNKHHEWQIAVNSRMSVISEHIADLQELLKDDEE